MPRDVQYYSPCCCCNQLTEVRSELGEPLTGIRCVLCERHYCHECWSAGWAFEPGRESCRYCAEDY